MRKIFKFPELLQSLQISDERPLLIGIDGRPCSGKSTLADLLIVELGAQGLFLDDFFIPQKEWPSGIKPTFPFPYFRYHEFQEGVVKLAKGVPFQYKPYDWETNKLGEIKTIDPKKIIIVEGVSVLNKDLASCYYKKILVTSSQDNEFEAISHRENKNNLKVWRELYLPSIDLYWRSRSWEQADILYAGRGI